MDTKKENNQILLVSVYAGEKGRRHRLRVPAGVDFGANLTIANPATGEYIEAFLAAKGATSNSAPTNTQQ